MKRKRYFKLMHINLTKDLSDYLNWRSDHTSRSVSEIVRGLIKDDLIRNKDNWFKSVTNEYDALISASNIMK